jgi:GNAT superfamily N-acetyltransferase
VPDVPGVSAASDAAVARHLDAFLGRWPAREGTVEVVGSRRRSQPGWDGRVHPLFGVLTPTSGVVSVPYERVDAVRAAIGGRGVADLGAAMGTPGGRTLYGVFRYTSEPTPFPDAGVWLPIDDPVVPPWLEPFGGEVLVALEDGEYVAGVGLKRHDPTGEEIAVVTEPRAEGKGLARRLVSQASRQVVARAGVVTYLHAPENLASAHVAAACNFPDLGWRVMGVGAG